MTLFDSGGFVAGCIEASKAADPVSALRIQIERAIADRGAVERRFPVPVDPDDDGILHQSTDLLITCAIFPRGFATGIHDHSVPAIIGLWAGSEENRLYRRTPTGIEMTGSQLVQSGEVIVLEADAIHDVRVSPAGWSGGLHVYLGDILEADRSEWVDEASAATRFDPEDQERRWTVAAESTGLLAQPSASAPNGTSGAQRCGEVRVVDDGRVVNGARRAGRLARVGRPDPGSARPPRR